nr:hypothetical protein [Tanacetum cinerariifolium]
MRRVGKGFSGVDTPLFEGMLVEQQVANDIANIAVNEVVDDVAEDVAEPTQPSPILTTTPSPPQELPSTSQVAPTPTPSPIAQPSLPPLQQQPSQPTKFSMDLLQSLLETCIALTKRVENLEQDKIAQALEIIKLKQRVKKLEKKKKLRVQFWSSVSLKKTNDVVRLQALIDRIKVMITEDTVRQALRLDDADSIDCLPNEEIFAELVRMGYEKPSTKLTSYKAFFLAQWKFLSHTILQCCTYSIFITKSISHPPSSPSQQQQPSKPSQPTTISMDLLNKLLETYTNLTRRVENLEQDKIAQALEIARLKQRVRKSEKKTKLKASRKIVEIDAYEDVTWEEVAAEVTKDAEVQGRLEESQAHVYHLDSEHAQKVLITAAATTITAAPSAARRRNGVVIRDPKVIATPSVIVYSEPKYKDKGKGILVEEPKPLKKEAHIEQDEAYARELEVELNANINWNEVIEQVKRKEKQDNAFMRYQALKRKPQTKAHAMKNIMVYLKNMVGFKMDFFKAMSYDDIRPIFKKHFNSILAFLEKGEKELEEKASKATPLALKVPVVDYQIHTEHNKPYYKIISADGTHQLYLSFISLLRNLDREELEMLWKIVQERFASLKPKNFSYDFLLNTLKTMFEKPNV